jgi:periplasmic protein TonB
MTRKSFLNESRKGLSMASLHPDFQDFGPAPRAAGMLRRQAGPGYAAAGRGSAGLASAIVVGVLFSALAWIEVDPLQRPVHAPLVVSMALTANPAPSAAKARPQPVPPQHASPAPQPRLVITPREAPVAPGPAPAPVIAPPAPVAPPAPPAPPAAMAAAGSGEVASPAAGPVNGGDLSARLLSFKAPAYPIDSRRQREQGTVSLALLVDTEGRVAEISVGHSSGFPRLDQAALDAVRHWRWAPLMVHGTPAMVRGEVRIPFVLKG